MIGCNNDMTERNNQTSPLDLDIERAYQFYIEAIIGSINSRKQWYEEYGFNNPRTTSGDWEVFGAILLRQRKSNNPYGHDLEQAEVKSSGLSGGGFEYQYHKNGGVTKLDQEHTINHVFVVYSPNYSTLTVYVVKGADLKNIFDSWRDALLKNYQGSAAQRFRKSIPRRVVVTKGQVVMEVKLGRLVSSSVQPKLEI
jgi:hypothetical protein